MSIEIQNVLAVHGIQVSEDELAHYGTKGMKWGKRRAAKAEAKATAAAQPKVKDLSDDELKARINRLKLEKEYKTLTSAQVSSGRKIVAELLLDVGKTQAKDVLNREVGKAIAKGLAVGAAKAAARRAIR